MIVREMPYTNLHDLNIDWILKVIEDFRARYQNLDETFQNMLQQIETAGNNAVEAINNNEETALEAIRVFLEQCIQAIDSETSGQIEAIENAGTNQIGLIDQEATSKLGEISNAGVAQVNIINGLITTLPQTYEDSVNQLQIINAVLNQTYNYPPLVQGHYADANESDSKTLVADNYRVSTLLSSGCASKKIKIQVTNVAGIIRDIIYWTGWGDSAISHNVPVSTSASDEKTLYTYTFPANATYFTIVFAYDYNMGTQLLVSDIQVSLQWQFNALESIELYEHGFDSSNTNALEFVMPGNTNLSIEEGSEIDEIDVAGGSKSVATSHKLKDSVARESVSELKSTIDSVKNADPSSPIEMEWEDGAFGSQTGLPVEDGNPAYSRCLTYFDASKLIKISNPNELELYAYRYTKSGGVYTYVGVDAVYSSTTEFSFDKGMQFFFRFGGHFSAENRPYVYLYGDTLIVENIKANKQNLTLLNANIEKTRFIQVDFRFENRRGYVYSYIGENLNNNYTTRADRAVAFIERLPIGSKIIFDNSLCAVNYYIVGYNNIHNMIYTPDAWHTSGEVTIEAPNKAVYQNDNSVIVQIKKANNTDISDSDLATIAAAMTINYNASITDGNTADVIIFAGQSNIAGRGVTNASHPETAPSVPFGIAYEYKAITAPTTLYPLDNSFGANENKSGYIDDQNKKTGSLVPAFVNAYRAVSGNNFPLICVSASEGGTSIASWKNNKITDAVQRLTDCLTFLATKNINVRHVYVCWCQGETDGDNGTAKATYLSDLATVMDAFKNAGAEKCLLIRIGNCNISGSYDRYTNLINWQTELAQTDTFYVMVSCDFAGMRERGMMKDDFHYYQDGYNECGAYAGVNAGIYAASGKEPTM